MSGAGWKSVVGGLHPRVAEYRAGCFVLADELAKMLRVREQQAPEAVALYAARILEVLAAEALRTLGLEPAANVFANIELLRQYDLMHTPMLYWADAVRRLGNVVRHVHRPVSDDDADLAALFVERLLRWFFCDMLPDPVAVLTRDGQPLRLSRGDRLRQTTERLEDPCLDAPAVAKEVHDDECHAVRQSPIHLAVLGEILLDSETPSERTLQFLRMARDRYDDDLRLRQLMALYWHRRECPEKAVTLLEELYESTGGGDEETAGIYAAACKAMWLKLRSRSRGRAPEAESRAAGSARRAGAEWLRKSHDAYSQGWKRSRASTWLGINVAATALWLGNPKRSRRAAADVREALLDRESHCARPGSEKVKFGYWEQVTLAEAELLLGNLDIARRRYTDAARAFPEKRGDIDVAERQLDLNLPALGLGYAAREFLGRPIPDEGEIFFAIGVAGHRTLPADDPDFDAAIAGVLNRAERIRAGRGAAGVTIINSLAEGADRLVARRALESIERARLHVVLPLEIEDYRDDFATEDSRDEFQSLLDRCERIVFPPRADQPRRGRGEPPAKRPAAYAWAGREVVDSCELLIALWDGGAANGRGGTAEVVGYARERNRLVAWVRTTPPFDVSYEGPADPAS